MDTDYINLILVDVTNGTNKNPPRDEWEEQLKEDLEEEIAEIKELGGTVDFPTD